MARTRSTYRPFSVTFTTEHGERATWDTYPSRAAAQKAIDEDAENFGLTGAAVAFRGVWSRYPTQDRDIARYDLTEATRVLAWTLDTLGRSVGRARNTHLAMAGGLRKRIAALEA